MATSPVSSSNPQLTRTLVWALLLGGILGVIAGLIHAVSILTSGFTTMRLGDTVINLLFGALLLGCSRLLARGNRLVIPLYLGTVGLSLVYSWAVGRGFNVVIFVIGIVGGVVLVSLLRPHRS